MIYELHKPKAGDDTVLLMRPYQLGTNNISVFKNGTELTIAHDYLELSATEIRLLSILADTDVIVVRFSAQQNTTLPQKYGNTTRLLPNNEYTLEISLPELEHTYSFTSRYDPLFTSLKIIRNDLGDWLEDVKDDDINFMIHTTSLTALELLGEDIPDPLPNYVRQYVRYKTEAALLRQVYLGEIKNHKISKTLGNLSIDKQSRMPEIKELLSALDKDISHWESMMFGGNFRITPRSATKSRLLEDYPLSARRSF